MKYHKQLSLHDPEKGTKGSCYPTVLACILDLELYEVPNFHLFYLSDKQKATAKKVFDHLYLKDGPYDEAESYQKENHDHNYSLLQNHWYNTLVYWMAMHGCVERVIPKEYYQAWLTVNKDRPYLVSGMSPRNIGHVVVYMNGIMIHDPHPSGAGLTTIHDHEPYSFLDKIA